MWKRFGPPKTERALTLRNSAELKRLIRNEEGGNSPRGVIGLGPLIEFVQRRGAGPIEAADLTSTPYRAEAEAEAILKAVGKDGAPVAHQQALTSNTLETAEFVKTTVNKQMLRATAPEEPLVYSKIPNTADEDTAQKTILNSFEVRKGPTDVTSYHDFHTLQIAFEHVWTEIFDGQLASLGRELYAKYVDLKDFTGSSAPDPTISTLADLRRLIDEVRTLMNFTEGAMPGTGRGNPDASTQTKPGSSKDWTDLWKDLVPPDPLSRLTADFIDLIINELNKAGKKDRLSWDQLLQGRPLPRPQDEIVAQVEYNMAGAGKVEIKLKTPQQSRWRGIEFQQFDSRIGPNPIYRAVLTNNSNDPVSQYPGGPPNDGGPIVLDVSQVSGGVIEFDSVDGAPSEKKSGRYLLFDLGQVLTERTRVTFDWRKA